MKIDFSQELIGFDGEPLEKMVDKTKSPMTLGDAVVGALTADLNPMFSKIDHDVPGKVKFDRWQLAAKIKAGSEVDMTVDELAMAKKRVGEVNSPVIVGPAWKLLDPAMANKEA